MRHSLTVIPETNAKEGSEVGYGIGSKVFCRRFETNVGKQLISKVSDLGKGFTDYPARWEARLLLLIGSLLFSLVFLYWNEYSTRRNSIRRCFSTFCSTRASG